MSDIRGASRGIYNSSLEEKYLILTLFVLVLFILFSGGFGLVKLLNKTLYEVDAPSCGDGTLYNSCSDVKPYFCSDGKLIELASVCNCSEGFTIKEDGCFSDYQTDSKTIPLKYTLNSQRNSIEFVVYKGFADYIANVPRSISYSQGENFSRANFTLKAINEEEQRKMLLPLVIKIKNITNDPEDQMRIAVSIVQNIPFKPSNKTLIIGDIEINYSRYPYEVLYDYEGICGEKTDLLLFLLREMRYNTSFLYYAAENHEAVGIKCPVKESVIESGYCFVETTGPSIITNDQLYYVGTGKLFSAPEVYPISDGKAIGEDIDEYHDAKTFIRISNSMEKNGVIGPIRKRIYDSIRLRYGLPEEYYR